MVEDDALTGEDRCWPCTVANAAAGLLVAVPPVVVAWLAGDRHLLLGAAVWALLVVGFTAHHLLRRGYLPGADRVAKRTGLHDWIGPGRGGEDPGRGAGGPGEGADRGDRPAADEAGE